jgi:hypothetical protein
MSVARNSCLLTVCVWACAVGGRIAAQPREPTPAGFDAAEAMDSQVIDDPELAAAPRGPNDAAAPTGAAMRASDTTIPAFVCDARLRLHSRLGLDLFYSDPREETWESTSIAAFEATVRRSENVRLAVGLRARFQAASLRRDVADAAAARAQLDVAPTAGYVDLKMGAANLQLGYQSVQVGSFDAISAVDVLSVVDIRAGPATLPEASAVAQLAVRLDYDPTASLSLRALYVPFFTPHILSIAEGDYAIGHLRQSQVESGISNLGVDKAVLAANLSRTDRERLAGTGLSVFAPELNFAAQQAALRVTWHGTLGELSVTIFATRERWKSLNASRKRRARFESSTGASVWSHWTARSTWPRSR